MMTTLDCKAKWTVWVDGDNEANDTFTRAFKEIHPEHAAYMDRLSFSGIEEDSDQERIDCRCESVEDLQWMLTAAMRTGNRYGFFVTLSESDKQEYETAVFVQAGSSTFGFKTIVRVKSGAESETLQKRIRSAVSVLNGGAA